MDLPKRKISYWKARFIDGLPPLFVKRVKKNLRGDLSEITYDNYTYGKLIGTFTQEGLNLSNELKPSQQGKRNQMSEKSQFGDFCTQVGIDGPSRDNRKKKSYDENDPKKSHK